MTTNPLPGPDDSDFDARLRSLYDAAGEEATAPPPAPGAWGSVEARLRPAGGRRGWPLVSGVAGVLVGALLTSWWSAPVARPGAGGFSQNSLSVNTITPAVRPVAVPAAGYDLAARRAAVAPAPVVAATAAPAASITPRASSHGNIRAPFAGSGQPQTWASVPVAAPALAVPLAPGLASAASASAASAASASAASAASASASAALPATSAVGSAGAAPAASGAASAGSAGAGAATVAPVVSALLSGPPTHSLVLPDYLLPVVDADFSYSHLPVADSLRSARRVAMRVERAALAVLVHRADSLLLTLGEAAAPVVPAVAVATADSVRPVAPFSRWSVLVAGAPERSFLGLQASATDSVTALRRTHEQGRGGFNAAVLAEYRLTHRWSLAAGAGLSTTNSELRFTDRRTEVGVTYDTTVATTRKTDEVTARAYLIQYVPEPHPTPVFNLNGQVVGYDTVWINRADTTWTVYTATLVTQSTVKTVTPLISRHEVVNARILRPTYRFLTVPLLLRYRFGRLTDWASSATAPRWWADVAVGAQLQFFLGGSHLVTADGGRTYRTERVGRHETAFRPMNVTLLGQVAANYALTSALSVSVAPTMRWQPQSVYRPSTGLQQKPTATGIQLGVRYSF